LIFFFPLISNFWQVGGGSALLSDLEGVATLKTLILICIFVALSTN